jgi:hypothetical protein
MNVPPVVDFYGQIQVLELAVNLFTSRLSALCADRRLSLSEITQTVFSFRKYLLKI